MDTSNFQHQVTPAPISNFVVERANLIRACFDLLQNKGVPIARLAVMMGDSVIKASLTMGLNEQRYALNLFWQAQLGPFMTSAFRARGSLINSGAADDWLKYFDNNVVPFILDNLLPYPWDQHELNALTPAPAPVVAAEPAEDPLLG